MRLSSGKETVARSTPFQWVLLFASAGTATCSLFVHGYQGLAFVAACLVAINLVLVLNTASDALVTRCPGKFILAASSFVFFWMGVLAAALDRPEFLVADALHIGGGQWPIDLVQQAFLYITVFQLMLFIGYNLRPRMQSLVRWLRSRPDCITPVNRVLPYMLASLGYLSLLLAFSFDTSAVVRKLLAMRSAEATQGVDIGLLQYLDLFAFYGAAFVFLSVFDSNRRAISRCVLLALAAVMMIPAVAGGARHLTLLVMLPAFVLLLQRMKGRMTLGRASRWIAFGILVYIFAQVQLAVRDSGLTHAEEMSSQDFLQTDAFGQFDSLLYAEFLVPSHHDYFREFAEPYFLIHWIPRAFWPEKPIMQSWLYYDTQFAGLASYNVTPSVIGQFHLNWGYPGVLFIGWWLGTLTAIADRVLVEIDSERHKAVGVVIGMFYAFLISSFRFYHPLYFYYVVFGFFGMFLLTRHADTGDILRGWRTDCTARKRSEIARAVARAIVH